MAPDLRTAAVFSVAVHSVLLWPGVWGQQPSVNVERGEVSLELELFSEAQVALPGQQPSPPPASEEEPWTKDREPSTPQQQPPPSEAAEQGAFTDAIPLGTANRPPRYPWLARLSGWEGTAVVQVRVGPDGHPGGMRLLRSSGYQALDDAAQAAVRQWRFVPAQRGGRPVPTKVQVPIRFRLINHEESP